MDPPLHTIPISQRPLHGPLTSRLFFPILFTTAQLGIGTAQWFAIPLLLIPVYGRGLFNAVISWTKDGYARLLILIIVLFAPSSFTLTTSHPNLVERDDKGRLTRLNLPDRLVVISNHQTYLDWMYIWILAAYAGHGAGIIILLKHSLRSIPLIGWGMRLFKFIFMKRSWAADREHLTRELVVLGRDASSETTESTSLLPKARSPLWLLIFPEGTINSDEERIKSLAHSKRQEIDDFKSVLHPRTTGLLFSLRTLLPLVSDLQLLDLTIGYPGVPFGKYPQEWYGLGSVFFRSVPPPTVHIHLRFYDNLSSPGSPIPSLVVKEADELASPDEARAFELWLREVWMEKEQRLKAFSETGKFEGPSEVVKIRQTKWYHNIAACGGGGLATPVVLAILIYCVVLGVKKL